MIIDKLKELILIYSQQISLESLRVITDMRMLLEIVEPKEEIKEEPKQIIKEEVSDKTIEGLREEYKEKYNKKAFNWWDKEVLISKLK